MLEELSIQCDERDARYLAGGNFFGSESRAPPPRPPLDSDFLDPEDLPDAPKGGTPTSSTIKLPGKQRS